MADLLRPPDNRFDDDDIVMPESGAPATSENTLQFVNGLCRMGRLDGEGWTNFRQGLLTFAIAEINAFPGGPDNCRIGDISAGIWAFYKGYMTCTSYTNRELQQLSDRLRKLGVSRHGEPGVTRTPDA